MKKFILLLLLVSSVNLYSQKVNQNSEKIVSSVHIDNFYPNGTINEHIDISYFYNERGFLDRIDRCVKVDRNVYKDVLQRLNNGKFKRTTYKNNIIVSEHRYEYVTNDYGLIETKLDKFKIGTDSVMKITGYSYKNIGEWVILTQVHRIQYVKDKNVWSAAHDVYYINFAYIDDNCFWQNMHSSTFSVNNTREYYNEDNGFIVGKYSNVKNDTNLNLNLFFSMLCWEICLDAHEFEFSSEWCGMRSDYILKNENGFEIETINNNGNIIEMNTKYKNGRVFRKMKINYLY